MPTLSKLPQLIRYNEYRSSIAWVVHRAGLKQQLSFVDWLWSVIAPSLGLKTIFDVLGTNSINTGIAYAQLTYSTHL